MADWWDFGDFNLGGGGGGSYDFGNWFDPGQFNLDFNFPSFDFGNFGFDPSQFNLGFDPSFFNFSDPLALPSFSSQFQPAFGQQPGMDFGLGGMQPAIGMAGAGSPLSLADLGFGGSNAPSMALPDAGLQQGSDPITNLMGSDAGQGAGYAGLQGDPFNPFGGGLQSTLPGASAQMGPGGTPFSNQLDLGAYAGPSGAPQPGAAPMGEAEKFAALLKGNQREPTTMDTIAKLAAAFGPTVLGGVGLGLQQANRPQRNPLEDDLLRARIASSGQQDALAKDRLQFEKDNAAAQMEAQAGMQESLLASRRPGGQGNIDALLKGNPQLAALYQALTKQTTDLAGGGSPEFNQLLQQIAGVDIAELERQAQQQIAQAQETAARTGVNPANIIAEINQRMLQEKAKALANARGTLVQMLQPGVNVFNGIGGLFGGLFQTPAAG